MRQGSALRLARVARLRDEVAEKQPCLTPSGMDSSRGSEVRGNHGEVALECDQPDQVEEERFPGAIFADDEAKAAPP